MAADEALLAARRRPDPDDGVRVGVAGRLAVVPRQVLDRHLDGDAVDVQAGEGIDAGHGGQALEEEVRLERAEVAEVEDGPEIHVETVRALACEHLAPAPERMNRLGGQRRVARDRVLADVARGAGQVRAEHLPVAVLVDPGDGVELLRFQVVSVRLAIWPVL